MFDCIVTNPPYIGTNERLPDEVRLHEPAGALFAGPDGLDDYRRLAPAIRRLLAPGGAAFLEIGHRQGDAVTALLAAQGFAVTLHRDLAGRARVGSIVGAPREQIAPSRRFYAGGGASVRGYGFQSIGPRDPDNDPVGGRSLAELSLEARVRTFGAFGIVPFLDAGNIYTGSVPRLSGMRYGTGLGVRYYSSFGPIRVDVGTPINPQRGDSRVAVYVSLGQAF